MSKTETMPHVRIQGPEAFAGMRKAGQLTAQALDEVTVLVREGVTTQEIDDFFMAFGEKHKALPATLNYRGYKKACCISLNHVVCHGIPGDKTLRDGDILNIDVTYIVDGWHGDSSRMYGVGSVPRAAERLVDVTYECLMRGIAAVKPGGYFGDIGHAIETYAHGERCSVVEDFCGHGLGRLFHEPPNVLHYGKKGTGPMLKPGMIFTIEPMINLGRKEVKVLGDGWTAVTRDKSLSAQFEHSVGVTESGVEIFTTSPGGMDRPPYVVRDK